MNRHSVLLIGMILFLFLMQSKTMSQTNCNEITKRNTQVIPELFSQGKSDSVAALVRKWNIICDDCEEAVRLNILMAVYNHTFNEDMIDQRIMNYLIEYRDKINYEKNICNLKSIDRERMKYFFSNPRFNRFSQELAAECMAGSRRNSVSYLLASFYHGDFDSAIVKLNRPAYHKSKLYSFYRYYREEVRDRYERYILLSAGYWFPAGKINAFRTHPVFGFSVGYQKNKYSFQLNSAIRFLRSDKKFLIFQRFNWQESNFLRSLVLSMDARKEIKRRSSSEMNLGLGVGVEYFNFSLPFKDQVTDTEASFFLTAGAAYKFYWSKDHSRFSEIQLKLNRYFSVFGEEGQYAFLLRLTFGLNLNERKSELLEYLYY